MTGPLKSSAIKSSQPIGTIRIAMKKRIETFRDGGWFRVSFVTLLRIDSEKVFARLECELRRTILESA